MNFYTAQIQPGDFQSETEAENIFEAIKYFAEEYKSKNNIVEQPGTDISIRVWNAYGEGF